VTGLQCAGGGDLCETGEPGICGQGVMQCRDGELTCVGLQESREETCNAIDDDCDGEIDDGDLCPTSEVCYQGQCQPRCGGGEFKCNSGLECGDEGVCLEPSCIGVDCAEGEVYRAGECVAACDGVVCPYGRSCRAGVCVDVCEGVECDEGYSCAVSFPEGPGEPIGLCASCGCTGCGEGFSCTGNLCIEDDCVDMTCNDGFRCEAGSCVDNCAGAECPTGLMCEAGACVPDPDYDGGGEGGAGGDDGGNSSSTGISLDGGVTSNSSSSSGSGGTAGGGGGKGLGDSKNLVEPAGCGCRVGGQSPAAPLSLATLLGLGLLLCRRRS
jgi:MYXO-CTERM domain-containing protein